MFCAVGSFIERLHVSNLSIFWLCQTLLVNTRIFLHQTRPSPDFTLILAANKHFIRFSPIFVCQNEDGDGWKRHFSSPRYSVSLSCNLFRLFCTIITVGAVLCLWFFFQKRRRKIHARRSMSDFGWKREDYRTRQQRNNDNENGFFVSLRVGLDVKGRGMKPKQFLCSSWYTQRLKLPIFIIVCFSYADMHAWLSESAMILSTSLLFKNSLTLPL